MELGGDGVALHGERRVTGQIILPRDGPHALKQLLEAAGGKLPQHHHYPGAAAQVDVQPRAVRRRAAAQDAPVLRLHVLQAQTLHLIGHQLLQPQQAGYHICHHVRRTSFVQIRIQQYTRLFAAAQPELRGKSLWLFRRKSAIIGNVNFRLRGLV